MKKLTSTLVAIGVLGLSGSVAAGDIASDSGFGIEAGGGYYWPDTKRDLKAGTTGAVGLEYRFNQHWAINGWYLRTQNLDTDDNLEDDGTVRGDASVESGHLDLTYYFSNGSFQPYVSLGGGQVQVDYDTDDENQNQWNFGFGAKWHLTPGFFFRGDLRGYRGVGNRTDASALITLGYQFGQKAKAQPVAAAAAVTAGAAAAVVAAPVGDSDDDGVNDDLDQCPNTIEGALVNDAGCGIKLTGAHFKFDSDELNLDAESLLDELAIRMAQYPDINVRVEGHTDSTGDEAYNVDLSQRRAQAAVDYLVSQGVAESRFEAVGLGSANPVASNDTEEGRTANRSVVFKRQ